MFDVGFTEVLLIGVVSLVVIGPERLPAVAKTAGQWIGKLQRFVKGVKTDLASELESGDLKKLIGDQREQIDELRQMVSTAKKDFQTTTRSVVKTTRESLAELETTVSDAKEEIAKVAEDSDVAPSDLPSDELSNAKFDNEADEKANVNSSAVTDARPMGQSDISLTKAADEQAKSANSTTPSASTAPSTKPLKVPMEPLLKPEPIPARTDSQDSDK